MIKHGPVQEYEEEWENIEQERRSYRKLQAKFRNSKTLGNQHSQREWKDPDERTPPLCVVLNDREREGCRRSAPVFQQTGPLRGRQ